MSQRLEYDYQLSQNTLKQAQTTHTGSNTSESTEEDTRELRVLEGQCRVLLEKRERMFNIMNTLCAQLAIIFRRFPDAENYFK
jgi:adenine-specific DNA methylase